MGKLILLTGGVKSGKSSLAVKLADKTSKEVLFVATALPVDEEMKLKIKKHRRSRPKKWQTLEVKSDLLSEVQSVKTQAEVLVLDCLTLYLAQKLTRSDFKKEDCFQKIKKFFSWAKKNFNVIIAVSNEVGSGVVPQTKIGRDFSELLGELNQLVASFAEEVYLLVTGIPLRIK